MQQTCQTIARRSDRVQTRDVCVLRDVCDRAATHERQDAASMCKDTRFGHECAKVVKIVSRSPFDVRRIWNRAVCHAHCKGVSSAVARYGIPPRVGKILKSSKGAVKPFLKKLKILHENV